jgi:ABC-type lipoprotein release transport system permease subunit
MNTWKLFLNEIKYRSFSSMLAALAVAIAVFSITAAHHFLADFDRETQQEVYKLQQRSQERMDKLENEARVFAKSLGFNIFIYNSRQNLDDFYINNTNTFYLTTEDAHLLAATKPPLLNHLLPFLRHKIYLPSINGNVIIAGIEGEIFIKQKFQKPMEVRIEPGQVQLGNTIAQKLNLKAGNIINIGGKEYNVTLCRKKLGTEDDIVIFMNLADAQQLLNLSDKISGILALSCNCAAGNSKLIRDSVRRTIPAADVVEFAIRAKARQRARKAISKAADAEIADITEARMRLREQLKNFSFTFSGLMVVTSTLLLIFLYARNVKERRHEIAILRTLGVRTAKIFLLFTVKSILLATIGSAIGYVCAVTAALYFTENSGLATLFNTKLSVIMLIAANLVSAFAGIIPVMIAAHRDPGIVLNEEI